MLKKLSKRVINKALSLAFNKPLKPLTGREKELVEELRAAFAELPYLDPKDSAPSEKTWFSYMNTLRDLVLSRDPRGFLEWDVVLYTMFVGHAKYIMTELQHLKSLPEWQNRWYEAIKETAVGRPLPYWYYPHSSGNLIHHAYHVAQFEAKTGLLANEMDYIFEFGGGYGSMCRLFYNLGFKGKYVIFDLPAFSALQRFFLKSIKIPVHTVDTFKQAKDGAICVSDLVQLKAALSTQPSLNKALFIATWSISETPINFRHTILPLTSRFEAFLIAYQHHFEEVNNIEFFREWKDAQNDVEWCNWEIAHLSHHNYLVGRRKNMS